MFLSIFFALFPVLLPSVWSDPIGPYYNFNENGFALYDLFQGNVGNEIICNTFPVYGGTNYFTDATVVSRQLTPNNPNAAYYQMNLTMGIFQPNYTNFLTGDVFLIIMANSKIIIDNISLTNPPLNRSNNCPEDSSLNNFERKISHLYSLTNFNLSSFRLTFNIVWSGFPTFNYNFPWGFTTLKVELWECDMKFCSSCYGLPRNCTKFCNIRCESCSPFNPDKCLSCYPPNTIDQISQMCQSTNEGLIANYFNDSFTDQNVLALKTNSIFYYDSLYHQPGFMSKCGAWPLLGGIPYCGNGSMISLVLNTSMNHFSLRVLFKFIKISSWDNEFFNFFINDNLSMNTSYYIFDDPLTGIICGASYLYNTATANFNVTLNHTDASVTLKFSTNLNSPPDDESWGLRDLYVTYYACSPGCDTCIGPTNADCVKCVANLYVNVNGVCVKCDSNCGTCMNTPTNCLTCIRLSYYQYLSGNVCVTKCPDHQFSNDGVCMNCSVECNQCAVSGGNCLSCVTPAYYAFPSLGYFICLPPNLCNSITAYYADSSNFMCSPCNSSCLTCTVNSTNCVTCATGYFKNTPGPGICGSNCPFGYYNDTSSSTCKQCHPYCSSCSDATNTKCSSCNPAYFLFNSTCDSTCPNTTVPDSTYQLCMLCQFPCKTCSGFTISCQSCQTNYTLLNSVCLTSCPVGYYQTPSQECKPCYGDCLTCTGPSSNNCSSCNTEYFNAPRNECVSVCPDGSVGINKTCQPCYYNCKNCLGLTENDCTTCSQNFFKQPNNGTCRYNCDPGYYADPDSWSCLQCDSPCQTCNGPSGSNCTSCKKATLVPYLFVNKTCISQCPQDYYQNYDDINNWKCLPCFAGCQSCLNYSANSCLSCQWSYYLYNNTCNFPGCPANLPIYPDFNTGKCLPCSIGCASCMDGSETSCWSCLTGSYFYRNSCRTICPDGFFPNKVTLNCDSCYPTCLTCFGSANNSCFTCPNGTFLLNKTCLPLCPNGYFANTTSETCDKCLGICLLCQGTANNCSSCVSSYYLSGNKCLSDCPDGSYKAINSTGGTCQNCSKSCSNCYNYSQCISCPNLTYLLNQDCLQSCPDYFWNSDLTNQCQSCYFSCKTCDDSSNNTCSSCAPHYYLFNSTCVQNCPPHYYKDEFFQECSFCDSACDLCVNETSSDCINCSASYYFLNDVCVNDCGDGYYPNITTKTCQKCSPECAQCNGSLVSNCQSCSSSYYLLQATSTCYKECPSAYYDDKINQECAKCDPTCKTCFGPTESNCYSCFLSTYLHFYKCLRQCPNGFYQNNNDQTCYPCHSSCSSCTGPFNNGSCLNCTKDLVLNDGTCIPSGTCPLGKWQNVSVCEWCNQSCRSCLGPGDHNCSSCKNGTYLLNGQCLQKCPPALVAVDEVWKCLKICDYTCSDCFGPAASQCNICPITRFLVQSSNVSSMCSCNSRYFPQSMDLKNATCLACDQTCNECNGPTASNCTRCPYNKDLINGSCLCPVGLYSNGLACERCSPYCYTCSGTSNNCSSCLGNQELTENYTCTCKKGFYPADRVCYACDYSCTKCSGPYPENCLSDGCAGNHIYKDEVCQCPFWSEDFGKNVTCTNKTKLNCDQTCNISQCFGPNPGNCYSCRADRALNNNSCPCTDGTYEDSSTTDLTCQKCYPSCKKCSGPLFSDCIDQCISKTRGASGTPIKGICDCSPGNIETLEAECPETPVLLQSFSSTFAATIYVNTPSMAMIALSQTTVVVTKFMETCQLFSYFAYLNLQYPLDTKSYFNMLNYFNIDPIFSSSDTVYGNNTSNTSNTTNLTNKTNSTEKNSLIQNPAPLQKSRILTESNKFDRIKYGHEEFLVNAWILLVLNGGLFVIAAIYSLIYHILNDEDNNSFWTKIRNILRWNLPIRVFSITSLQLFFYIGLKFNHECDWNSTDSILTIVIIIVLAFLLIYFIIIINFYYSDDGDTYYGALWDGVSTFFLIKRNYFIFNLLRKILVVTFITSITLDSITQILGCMITCIVFLAYIIFVKPFTTNLEWIFTIIMEICYCFLLVVVFVYSHISNENASEKITFGYAIIISLSIFMLATFIFAVIHIIKFIRKLYAIFSGKNEKLLTTNSTCDSTIASKIGKVYKEYSKEVEKKKDVVVVYSKKEEEKKQKKEEEKKKQLEMKNRFKDIEEEKKARMGLQNIFAKQKSKKNRRKDSFDEGEEKENQEEVETRENKDFEDVMKATGNENNKKIEQSNQKKEAVAEKKGRRGIGKKKKDSFEEDTENNEENENNQNGTKEVKEINIEMGNFDNF